MPFDESAYRKVQCTSDTPFIRMSQGQQKEEIVTVRDEQGEAVDLTQFEEPLPDVGYPVDVPAWMSSSSLVLTEYSSSSITPDILEVRLAASHSLKSSAVVFSMDGEIIDAELGQVKFSFTPSETSRAGIFVASVGVFWGGILRHQQMYYLEFMPTTFSTTSSTSLSVPEVRMDVADMCPDANYLIDSLEFTDAEILHCMRKAVDTFNETPPRVLCYNGTNFPFRAAWLKATAAFLLKMISHRYMRNTLDYSAAGVSVRDQRYQADTYRRIADAEIEKFETWSQQIQVAKNMDLGYGNVGPSPYGSSF